MIGRNKPKSPAPPALFPWQLRQKRLKNVRCWLIHTLIAGGALLIWNLLPAQAQLAAIDATGQLGALFLIWIVILAGWAIFVITDVFMLTLGWRRDRKRRA